jgi:trk system potassium uptake protein TrkA
MNVLIAGGGRTAAQLAMLLCAQNHQVTLVEGRRDILAQLHRELPTEVIYEGNPMDPHILEAAGIENAQIMAACTRADELNLALCFIARNRYHVPRTVARINNPRSAWLFDDKFSVDVAVNQAEIMGSLIEEEMSMGDMMTLLKIRRGNYSLVEEKIPEGAKAIDIPIKDLALPEDCIIAAIIRKGDIVLPRGITRLQAGDEVLAITDRDGAARLEALFCGSSDNQTATK